MLTKQQIQNANILKIQYKTITYFFSNKMSTYLCRNLKV